MVKQSSTASTSRWTTSSLLFCSALLLALCVGDKCQFTAVHDWDVIIATDSDPNGKHLTRAWSLIASFPDYPNWNSFTTSVSSASTPPTLGHPVQLTVNLGPPWPVSLFSTAQSNLTLDFYWKEYLPEQHTLCWGIDNPSYPILNKILSSHRCCALRFTPALGVEVRHSDLNVGYLAPLVQLMYKRTIEQGFSQMTVDMRKELART